MQEMTNTKGDEYEEEYPCERISYYSRIYANAGLLIDLDMTNFLKEGRKHAMHDDHQLFIMFIMQGL